MIKINENTLREIIRETILEALDERGSNMQSLYHFTDVRSLSQIILTDFLRLSNWQEDTRGGNFMSFTRHKSALEGFAKVARRNVRIEVDPVKINSIHGGGLAPFEYYSPHQFEINPFAKVHRNSDLGKGMSAKEKYREFGGMFKDYNENEYMNQAEEHYLSSDSTNRRIPNAHVFIKRIDVCMPLDMDEDDFSFNKEKLNDICYSLDSPLRSKIFVYENARDFNLQTNNCMPLRNWLINGTRNQYKYVVESVRK